MLLPHSVNIQPFNPDQYIFQVIHIFRIIDVKGLNTVFVLFLEKLFELHPKRLLSNLFFTNTVLMSRYTIFFQMNTRTK